MSISNNNILMEGNFATGINFPTFAVVCRSNRGKLFAIISRQQMTLKNTSHVARESHKTTQAIPVQLIQFSKTHSLLRLFIKSLNFCRTISYRTSIALCDKNQLAQDDFTIIRLEQQFLRCHWDTVLARYSPPSCGRRLLECIHRC